MTLDGKVALITGAKGGLGSSVTNAFLAAGATVAGSLAIHSNSDFDHPRFFAVPAELSNSDAARTVVDSVLARARRSIFWCISSVDSREDKPSQTRMIPLSKKCSR